MASPGTIALLDYGMGNLRSVQRAVEAVEGPLTIVREAEQVRGFDKVILPGVGAFGDAAAHLRDSGVAAAVREHIEAGKPFLGICLGLQLLFEVGREDGEHRGLGVLGGEVVPLEVDRTHELKVPHMGWNALRFDRPDCPLLRELEPGCHVYFVHAYHARAEQGAVAATADYGVPVTAMVWRDNVLAAQFHPEKSQDVGLRMLRNFVEL